MAFELNLADEAYTQVRAMIMDGEIGPGELIREGDMSTRLGMSRTPLREALHRLQAEKVVVVVPYKGYLVADLSEDELENIYNVREVLEGFAAELAASRATRVDLAHMDDLLQEMSEAMSEKSDQKLGQLNRQLHLQVAIAAHNPYLVDTLSNIGDIINRFRPTALRSESRRVQAHDEHAAIVDAIRARDVQKAGDVARAHVREALALRKTGVNDGTEEQGATSA